MDEVILSRSVGRVTIVTLNRPDSLNALNPGLMRALLDEVRRVAEDESVSCLILTGAGRGFCSGGDVRAISTAVADRVSRDVPSKTTLETRVRWLRRSVDASRLLREMPKPTIAMVNGACAGAGLSLAAACDLRFAARSARFRPAFTANGMPGDYGGTWLWTQILGGAKARQLYLIDEKRDAAAALAFGLVDRVYDDERLEEETLAVAHSLASLPATGFAYAKASLNAAPGQSFAEALDLESLNMMLARNALIELKKSETAQ